MKEKVRANSRKKSVFLPPKKEKKTPSLKQILRNKDIATFFRFVNRYKLREQALKAVNERIADA